MASQPPLNPQSLEHLHGLCFLATHDSRPNESIGYVLLLEALFFHKIELGHASFSLWPQIRFPWNPDGSDRRHTIPDLGIGRFGADKRLWLQGGAEQKAPVSVMKDLPDPSAVLQDLEFRGEVHKASLQAMDQIKAAIKNGALPEDCSIEWIVGVGPYFTIQPYGPFNEAELKTRGHRPNDSGDYAVSKQLSELRTTTGRPFQGDLYRIGTAEAAVALNNYLNSSSSILYDPRRARRSPI